MSKGLGKVERAVLSALDDAARAGDARLRALPTTVLVEVLYGPDATASEAEAVRRAVRSLKSKQHVTTRRVNLVTLTEEGDR